MPCSHSSSLGRRAFVAGGGGLLIGCTREASPPRRAVPTASTSLEASDAGARAAGDAAAHALFDAYPALAKTLPRVPLGRFPSAIERAASLAPGSTLYIKRDDDFARAGAEREREQARTSTISLAFSAARRSGSSSSTSERRARSRSGASSRSAASVRIRRSPSPCSAVRSDSPCAFIPRRSPSRRSPRRTSAQTRRRAPSWVSSTPSTKGTPAPSATLERATSYIALGLGGSAAGLGLEMRARRAAYRDRRRSRVEPRQRHRRDAARDPRRDHRFHPRPRRRRLGPRPGVLGESARGAPRRHALRSPWTRLRPPPLLEHHELARRRDRRRPRRLPEIREMNP